MTSKLAVIKPPACSSLATVSATTSPDAAATADRNGSVDGTTLLLVVPAIRSKQCSDLTCTKGTEAAYKGQAQLQGGLTWLREGTAWRGGRDVHRRLLAASWQRLAIWQSPLRLLLRRPCPTGRRSRCAVRRGGLRRAHLLRRQLLRSRHLHLHMWNTWG